VRRRVVILTLSLAALGGVAVPLAPLAHAEPRRPWACAANDQLRMGACVSDPIPYFLPQSN